MNLIDKFKITGIINNPKNIFRIYVSCDANDGDYIDGHRDISKDNFSKNILLQYVIAYVAKGYFGKFNPDNSWNDGYYGHHVYENKYFPWLGSYCSGYGLLLSAGMCDTMCHSISDISMTYFDENGMEHDVEIPDFDELFETIEEAQDFMNSLAEKEDYLEEFDEI